MSAFRSHLSPFDGFSCPGMKGARTNGPEGGTPIPLAPWRPLLPLHGDFFCPGCAPVLRFPVIFPYFSLFDSYVVFFPAPFLFYMFVFKPSVFFFSPDNVPLSIFSSSSFSSESSFPVSRDPPTKGTPNFPFFPSGGLF